MSEYFRCLITMTIGVLVSSCLPDTVPVKFIALNRSEIELILGTPDRECFQLIATVMPSDASKKEVHWSSSKRTVASVDQTGLVTAVQVSDDPVIITAMTEGGHTAFCMVTVLSAPPVFPPSEPQNVDYVDEYRVNHGPGVKIGETVWAPVNCGYHKIDFKYGKLYQWGRKYGQGYSGDLYDINSDDVGWYSDATTPTIEEGGVSVVTGNHKSKDNIFYRGLPKHHYNWVVPQDNKLWNSGSEISPVKTEYDPCPAGWRVPTYAELSGLCQNLSSWTSEEGLSGYWFSAGGTAIFKVPQVFFPAAGYRSSDGDTYARGDCGFYWSSRPYSNNSRYFYNSYFFTFFSGYANMDGDNRAFGLSVRCVQE